MKNKKVQFLYLILIFNIGQATLISYDVLDFQNNSQNFQKDFQIHKQQQDNSLTIWGWIKFDNENETSTSMQILKVSNIYFETNGIQQDDIQKCPWSFEQIKDDTNIRHSQEFKDNQDCLDYSNNITIEPIFELLYRQSQIIASLSQDDRQIPLQERTLAEQQVQFQKNEWNRILLAVDFDKKFVVVYFSNYTNGQAFKNKHFNNKNFRSVSLEKNIEITVSLFTQDQQDRSWQFQKLYFENIFVQQVQYIYMIETQNDQQITNDILIDHHFCKQVQMDDRINLEGNFDLTQSYKNENCGISIKNDNYIKVSIPKQDDLNDQQMYLIKFKIVKQSHEQIIIFQKGNKEQDNYMSVTLENSKENFNLVYVLKGSNQRIEYRSQQNLKLNKIYTILFGVKTQPNDNTILILKQDDAEFQIIDQQVHNKFIISSENYELVKTIKTDNEQSEIILYRFSIINNLQTFFQFLKSTQNSQCIHTLQYNNQNLCLTCKELIQQPSYTCRNQCKFGYFNFGNNVCIKCKTETCSSISQKQYQIEQQDNNIFILKFLQKFSDQNAQILDVIELEIKQQDGSNFKEFEYQIEKQPDQEVYVIDITYLQELIGAKLYINIRNSEKQLNFQNGNVLYDAQQSFDLAYICFVKDSTIKAVQFFAYFIMCLFCLCLILLTIFSCQNKKTDKNYSTLWKYLLMIWIKIQNVSMSYLVGTNGPCTSGVFFETLFKINAKWMNTSNFFRTIYEDVPSYENFLKQNQPQNQIFFNQNIQRFILNNVGIILFFHLIVFLIFTTVKFISSESKSRSLRKIVYMFQYSLLIIFYLIFSVQINIYAFINLRKLNENSFLASTLLSIFYVLFFLIFIFYFFIIIRKNRQYWNKGPLNKKLFFFTCGYRNTNFVKTFDLIVFFISFLQWFFVGFLYKEPLIQTILLFISSLGIIICALIYGPWVYKSINILEVVSMSFGCIPLVFAIIIASWSKTNNPFIGDREGFIAYSILVSIIISLLISITLFLILLFRVTFNFKSVSRIQYPKNPFLGCKIQKENFNSEHSVDVDISEDEDYSKEHSDNVEIVQIKYKQEAKKRITHLKSLKDNKKIAKNQKQPLNQSKKDAQNEQSQEDIQINNQQKVEDNQSLELKTISDTNL